MLVLWRPRAWLVLAGIAGTLAILGMYVYSRTNGAPIGPHEGVPEPPGVYDMVAAAGELVLVLVLVLMLAEAARRWAMRLVLLAAGRCGWAGRRASWCDVSTAVGTRLRPRAAPGRRAGRRWTVVCLLLPLALLLGCRLLVAEPFAIPSRSMEPTLHAGDRVIASKLAYRLGAPPAGELAVLEAPDGELLAKRIVAVGGQRVEIRDGVLFVDRIPRREPYVEHSRVNGFFFGPARVPAGSVFVLGDNRGDSEDSRDFGAVPRERPIGRVVLRIPSLRRVLYGSRRPPPRTGANVPAVTTVAATFNALVGDLEYPMFIVTARAQGEPLGCLVGFATQTSIDPPRMAVCLSHKNRTFRRGQDAPALGVHCVPAHAGALAELFGGETGDEVDKFERCAWHDGPEGVPLLDECPNRFVGRVLWHGDAGDHDVFLLEPMAAERRTDEGEFTFHRAKRIDAGHEA